MLSLEEGEDLRATAKAKGLQIGCAPDTFLGGAHQQARALIDEGAIGRITSGTCHVMGYGLEHWHPNPDFFFKPGAGPVLDIGPYYVANLINLVGPVRRVTAITGSARQEREITSEPRTRSVLKVETPTTIHAVMEFHNGAIDNPGRFLGRRSASAFQHGTLRHRRFALRARSQLLWRRSGHGAPRWRRGTSSSPGSIRLASPIGSGPNGPAFANYRTAGLADMMQAIDAGRPPRCSLDTTLHGVDVMTSILKSGEIGQAITLSTTCERPEALGPVEAQALLA